MNVMNTLAVRIGKKSVAIDKDQTKITNLQDQIDIYQKAIDRTKIDMAQKRDEVDLLLDLKAEAETLTKERDKLQSYTDVLVEKFGAIEWTPELKWEEKIESTDYAEKIAERQEINERLAEIEKTANKIYFRR